MPATDPSFSAFPADLHAAFPQADLLWGLLEASLTGFALYTPLRDAEERLVDFHIALLNPAAQRILSQPARPGGTYLGHYPHTRETGVFAFHRDVFESGQPDRLHVNYQGDGLDNYFLLSARRVGEGLLVSFTDTADQPRSEVEIALRQAQRQLQTAHQAAETQRQYWQQVLEQAPVAIATLDGPNYCITLANPAVCEIWARTQAQVVGLPLFEALPEVQGQGLEALLEGVLRTGQPYVGKELPIELLRHGRSETVYFNFVYQPQRNPAGATTGILVVASDVTEQVVSRLRVEHQEHETSKLNEQLRAGNEAMLQTNRSLQTTQHELRQLNQELEARVQARTRLVREQGQRLERLFMQAPAAICILAGPELVYELVNPVYQQLFPDRHLLGQRLLDALPELADHPAYHSIRRVFDTGASDWQQALHTPLARTENGGLEDRHFNYVQQPRYNEHGRVDGVLVFGFEVTELVRARQATDASARQLRLITDALPVLIGYLDRELTYRFANQAYQPWFGLAPDEMLGRSIQEIADPQAYSNIRPYLERALTGERVEFEAEMPFRAHLLKHIHTVYIPDVHESTVRGLYTLVSDITEQVEARRAVETSAQQAQALAQELATANEQLTRTNVDLDNFIYTASHDLKAPITNIEGLLDTLQHELPEQLPGSEVTYILDLMHDSVRRFQRTIEHLTDVSKLQKEHNPPIQQVALAPVIEDVRLDLAPLLQQTGGRLVVRVPPSLLLTFSEKNLRSVVYNLLSNALKYRHPERPPLVRLSTRLEGAFVVLEVQDNGLGLDLTRQEHLFAMFQRLHTHVEGSGLGLYMVKRMVENAGGRIAVASQLGEGSTFSVYFPA
jgi:PAS domain S-box-containing protein